MKYFPFYEKSFFIPALVLSASLHVFLIGASGWSSGVPYASVLRAPNSLEVIVISQPVVSVIEEEIVFEEIIESDALKEVVFNNQTQEPVKERNSAKVVSSEALRGAVTRAEPLLHVNPAPLYPRIARQRGWEGIVRLDVIVKCDGIPGEVSVRESSGYGVLDKAALQTVKKWKFSPARSGAIKLLSRVTIPIQFALVKEGTR